MMASRGKDVAALAPLVKPDDDSKRAVAALNAAGPAATRVHAQFVIAASCGDQPLAPPAHAQVDNVQLVHSLLERSARAIARRKHSTVEATAGLVALGLDEACAREVASAVHARRAQLHAALEAAAPAYPTLDRLRWRVDVVISSSAANKVMRPSLLLEMATSEGRLVAAEVPMAAFHELRYNVAKVCQEMGAVESHPVLRIQ